MGYDQFCMHFDHSWLYQIVSEVKHNLVYKVKIHFSEICLQLWTVRKTFAFSAYLAFKKEIATGTSLADYVVT